MTCTLFHGSAYVQRVRELHMTYVSCVYAINDSHMHIHRDNLVVVQHGQGVKAQRGQLPLLCGQRHRAGQRPTDVEGVAQDCTSVRASVPAADPDAAAPAA